jgi:beta-galactosidase
VRVANTGKNSRWYSGSGIYRHVKIISRPALHLATDGVRLTTPHIKRQSPTEASAATVTVFATVHNSGAETVNGAIVSAIVGRATSHVKVAIEAHSVKIVSLNVSVTSVKLWSSDAPTLHNASVSVSGGSAEYAGSADAVVISFGFRTLEFDAVNGFRLNGIETKLYGGCVHHDNGALGSAAIDRAEERRVELLKKQGYNAIRTSHNPVSPAFLDACDRLGMMVMCEAFDTWPLGKNTDDYHQDFNRWWRRDLSGMVQRNWNRASIVMVSGF